LYWGYIVIFTNDLTIYHSWIHSLHHSPLSSLPHSWNSFNRSHFSIDIHACIIFPSYSPLILLSFCKASGWAWHIETRRVGPLAPTQVIAYEIINIGPDIICLVFIKRRYWGTETNMNKGWKKWRARGCYYVKKQL
jgi:hypothetical protein